MAIVDIKINGCNGSEYVLIPACCYNGNRFKSLKVPYPPMYDSKDFGVDIVTTITDVPRLNEDGSGIIEVTTGDASVPCIGVFTPSMNKCTFVFTVQEIDGENLGLAYEKGIARLTYPAKRSYKYIWPQMVKK